MNEVLAEIGADSIPQIVVYNKIDRLQRPAAIERDDGGMPSAVWISAQTAPRARPADATPSRSGCRGSRVPCGCACPRARVRCAPGSTPPKSVREEHTAQDGSIELTVELPEVEIRALERTAGVQILQAPQPDIPCASLDAYLESITG